MTQSISDIEKCLRIRISSGSQQNSSHYSQYMSLTKLQSRPRRTSASASADSLNSYDHQSCYYHLETRDRQAARPGSPRQNQEKNKKCINYNTTSYGKTEYIYKPYNPLSSSAAEHSRDCNECNSTPTEKYLLVNSKYCFNKFSRFNMASNEKPSSKPIPPTCPPQCENYTFSCFGNYNPATNVTTPLPMPTATVSPGGQPNFQSYGVPLSREHTDHVRSSRMDMYALTFTTIMSTLATQMVKVIYAMLLMFMQLVPVVEVFGNIIHFAVEHICDIRHTSNKQDMMIKCGVFVAQILVMVAGILFVICAILLPVFTLILCVLRRFFFFI